MAKFVNDKIVKIYQTYLDNIREDLGRPVYIYYQTGSPTTSDGDGWDPINEEPIDPTATITYTESVITVDKVLIKWGPEDEWMRLAGGALAPNQARLKMKLSKVLVNQSNVNGATYFDNARKVVVDGIDCTVKAGGWKTGLRDLFNLIIIVEKSTA